MLRHRDIVAARRAFDEGDEAHAIKLSQAAHSLRSVEPEPGSPTTLASTGWTESGHNDELQHTRTTLVLRGCVDGVAISLSALAVVESVGIDIPNRHRRVRFRPALLQGLDPSRQHRYIQVVSLRQPRRSVLVVLAQEFLRRDKYSAV